MNLVERGVLGIGVGYAVMILGTLGLHYLPGPITRRAMLLAFTLTGASGIIAAVLVILRLIWRRRFTSPGGRDNQTSEVFRNLRGLNLGIPWLSLVILLALSIFFRFTFLGYSQFQGDEGKVMLRVGAAIRGDEETLFFHKKGPAEILLPVIPYVLRGQTNEFWARSPFAVASVITVIAVYALGWRMFNERVGFIAGLLMAINGFLIAFARIVQYQSILLLVMTLAFLCFYRFYQEARDGRYLLLGSTFLGVGLLAHYDIIFVMPAIAYLLLKRLGFSLRAYKKYLFPLLISLVIFVAITLPFYLPFIRHPHFAETYEYIAERRVGVGSTSLTGGSPLLRNNLWQFLVVSTTYNSTYYVLFLALSGGAVLLWWLRTPVGVPPLTGVNSGSPLRAVILIWFFVPFLILAFLMTKPGTHYYVSAPAWSLAGALVTDRAWHTANVRWHSFPARALRYLVLGVGYLIFVYYVYVIFVQHDPEYIRTYPEHRNRWYWAVYGDQYLSRANFGFPYQTGWKVIGHLYKTGILQGDYYSNEKYENTQWYTQGATYTEHNPRYYFIAERVEGARYVPLERVRVEYTLIGDVLVNGAPTLHVYERDSCARRYTIYNLKDYEADYDRYTAPRLWGQMPVMDYVPLVRLHQPTNLGHEVQLLGYRAESDYANATVKPGDSLLLSLYWRALQEMDKVYVVFVHLEDDRIWGQHDSIPVCGARPFKTWKPGEIIVDRHEVPISPDTPVGEYPLLVGVYEWPSGERLQILDENGTARGNSVLLRSITVAK